MQLLAAAVLLAVPLPTRFVVGSAPIWANAGTDCKRQREPQHTRCTGCPPMYNGKLCASTTRYNDQTKAACGCGKSDPIPSDWWTLTTFTAALNCKSLDSRDPLLSWCPMGCGGCYRLCTTGGTTQGVPTVPDKCRVFKITNRCGDGFGKVGGDWCSNRLSWKECLEDPEKCMEEGSTNWFGYSAHFDLQDFHHQIKDLQWDNVEVTFEQVPCNKSWHGPSWDCSCPPSNEALSRPSNETLPRPSNESLPIPSNETLPRPLVPGNISTPMRANTRPSMGRGADTHDIRAKTWSIFDSALTVLERHADEAAAINTTIETVQVAWVSSTLKVEAQTPHATTGLRGTTAGASDGWLSTEAQTPHTTTGLRQTTASASHGWPSTGPDFLAEPGMFLDDETQTGLSTTGTIEPSVHHAIMQQQEGIVLKPEGVPAGGEAYEEAENEQEKQKKKRNDKDKEKEDNLEEVKEKEKEKEKEDKLDEEEGGARNNCAGAFQQCGGRAWSGPTCCQQGCSCSGGGNVFYRQCIPPAGLNSCNEADGKTAKPSAADDSDSVLVSFVSRGGADITGPAAAVQAVDPRLVPKEASWIADASRHGIPDNQPLPKTSSNTSFSWTSIRIRTWANWQVLASLCALLAGAVVGMSSFGFQRGNRIGRSRLGAEHSDSQEATTPCSDCLKSFLSPLWTGWWPLSNASGTAHRLPETA